MMIPRRPFFALQMIAGSLSALAAVLAAPALAEPTLIENVRVFDGEAVYAERSVLIDGNRIVEDDFRGRPPEGAQVVNGTGRTLLPGLIDAHVHAYAGLDDALLFGVTTELDMFAAPRMIAAARARTDANDNPREADLHSAGILATAPSGHGTQFGVNVPTLTAPDQAEAWVADRIAEGSEYIKIVIEPGGGAIRRELNTLDAATVQALVKAAHARGTLAVAHATTKAAAQIAIDAGADGLVHFFADEPIDDAMLAKLKRQKMFVSPTFVVFEGFAGRAGSAALLEEPGMAGLLDRQAVGNLAAPVKSDRIARFAPAMEANIMALQRAGIPVLAGSDAPNPGTWFGVSLHREIELLVASGLTPKQALVAATSAPATAYRLAGHGRIADGGFADLLLVDGDPTQDIAALRRIVQVWKDGQPVSALRDERRKRIAAAIPAAARQPPALAGSEDGPVATFSDDKGSVAIAAPFGAWSLSTDAMMGGASTANASLTGEGALRLIGTVAPGGFVQWAGIAWMLGAQPMAPVDLSAWSGIAFRIRGTGNGPGVMGFSLAGGQRPSVTATTIGKDWSEVVVTFADLPRFDPKGATMLLIGILEAGDYDVEIDDVRLVTR